MKKILLILITPLFFIFFALQVSAQSNFNSGETVQLPRNETVNKDYFTAGQNVTVSGTVNGDAYVAGGDVLVDGTINGDLLVAGGTVTVRGTVANNIRSAGGNVTISGNVGGNVTSVGGNIQITDSAKIAKNLVAAGGTVKVFAPVGKDTTIGAGQVTLGNNTSGDVNAAAGELSLTSDAKIGGNLNYWSNQTFNNQGASISGKTTFHKTEKNNFNAQQSARAAAGFASFFKIMNFLTYLIIGLLLVKFMPVYMKRTADTLISRPGASFLVGLVTLLIFPILFIILLFTIIGIPLAFVLLGSLLLIMYFLRIFVALVTGILILRAVNRPTTLTWTYLWGLLLFELIIFIPVIGPLISFFSTFFALGAVLLEEKGFYNTLRQKELI